MLIIINENFHNIVYNIVCHLPVMETWSAVKAEKKTRTHQAKGIKLNKHVSEKWRNDTSSIALLYLC